MAKAVDVAESNMARFGLTPQELASRRKWVNKTREQVCTPAFLRSCHLPLCATACLIVTIVPAQCESIAAGLKAPQAAPRSNGTASSSAASKYDAAIRNENDRHIISESEQQQSLIRCVSSTLVQELPDNRCGKVSDKRTESHQPSIMWTAITIQ